MTWKNFLEVLCNRREYGLTVHESKVVLCLNESEHQTKNELLLTYVKSYSAIEEEAFTQRLRNIYRKFGITGNGQKLLQLQKYLTEKYTEYKRKDAFFSDVGLTYIYPNFPGNVFEKEIYNLINLENYHGDKKVDILQTFAPNLNDYYEHLIQCIQHNVQVRILLAWPYSEAAKLREDVLRQYGNDAITDDINIRECVIENLETLEKIIKKLGYSNLLDIKLYDTLPSVAIYRAGNYMLAGLFLHGSLAVNTFQFELNLNASNPLIAHTLQKDFELMWQVSRQFIPSPDRNWRSDLKILFTR